MPWNRLGPIVIAAVMLGPHAAAAAPPDDGPSPASLARIRKALEQPTPRRVLAPPSEVPTFRVEVGQPLVDLEPLEEEAFDPTWGLPSAGELLVSGIGKLASAAVDYKHHRAQRRARKEVQDALAAFCAVHACPAAGPQ
jgi:hypothetical protein